MWIVLLLECSRLACEGSRSPGNWIWIWKANQLIYEPWNRLCIQGTVLINLNNFEQKDPICFCVGLISWSIFCPDIFSIAVCHPVVIHCMWPNVGNVMICRTESMRCFTQCQNSGQLWTSGKFGFQTVIGITPIYIHWWMLFYVGCFPCQVAISKQHISALTISRVLVPTNQPISLKITC